VGVVSPQVIHKFQITIYTGFKVYIYLKYNNIIDVFDLLTGLTTTTVYIYSFKRAVIKGPEYEIHYIQGSASSAA
jgi:hypothetical protein